MHPRRLIRFRRRLRRRPLRLALNARGEAGYAADANSALAVNLRFEEAEARRRLAD